MPIWLVRGLRARFFPGDAQHVGVLAPLLLDGQAVLGLEELETLGAIGEPKERKSIPPFLTRIQSYCRSGISFILEFYV